MPSTIKLAAQIAIRDTRCTYSVAREIAEEMAQAADANGIAYDVAMLAEVTADVLTADGWID